MHLTTSRLTLREYVEDDWKAVLAYQSDPLYLRYYAWTGRTEIEVRDFLGRFIASQSEEPRWRYQLAIVENMEGKLIGSCGVRIIDAALKEGEMGYELDSNYWGRGFATEAAKAMLRFGFDVLGLHRISAHCVSENVGSARVLKKIGMTQEGTLREKEFFKDRWWDCQIFSILRDESKLESL
jgi:ribosomal-protein-alanine N-acetyltransferase